MQVEAAGRTVDFTCGWKSLPANKTGVDARQPGVNGPAWRDTGLPRGRSIDLDPVQGTSAITATGVAAGRRGSDGDVSYCGAQNAIQAAMLDGNGSTRWSNHYDKSATPQLPAASRAHATEWVSLSGVEGAPINSVQASFVIDSSHALPTAIAVSYWNGMVFVPVRDARVQWATESGKPTRVTFTPVSTGRIRLELADRARGTTRGFLGITGAAVGR